MWNFLWRLGVHAHDCTPGALPAPIGSVIWAALREGEEESHLQELRGWIGQGGYVVAEGDPAAAAAVFGWDTAAWSATSPENPYAALARVMPGRAPELLSPPGWHVAVSTRPQPDVHTCGVMAAVQGERQTPSRATLVPFVSAPALVAGSHYCYVNGSPFAALQAWLQGQEDLQPWLAWRHRLFWLDEWISDMAEALSALPALSAEVQRSGVPGLGATTIVLRHDLDHSRDLAYLHEEAARGLTATHCVLRDSNASFWRDALADYTGHECAFHYDTARRRWLLEARARFRRRGAVVVAPQRAAVTGRGLARQVEWAKTHRIGTASLSRHMGFLVYPEWVDALDYVFASHPDVRGASSSFRAQLLRWGADRVDGLFGTVGEWPDAQFPMWLPFKLAHAADGGRRLRGWESASLMECEPELVNQLVSHRIAWLPQRVITLGYHPAHARGKTFHRSGTLASFRRVLDVLADHRAQVEPLHRVFALADAAVAGTATDVGVSSASPALH